MFQRTTALVAILVGPAVIGFGADKPANKVKGAAAYDQFAEPWKGRLVAAWQEECKRAKTHLASVSRPLSGASRGSPAAEGNRRENIRLAKQRIRDLEENVDPFFPSLPDAASPPARPWQVGDWGTIPRDVTVLQVVGDHEMLARTVAAGERITIRLKGFSTAGLTDGSTVRVDGLAIITGTSRYSTVLKATNTVLVLEPLNGSR